ncbi:MAG: twin-arginine translocase subunit TatC [Alphaproteobacteria bacterium]|jgi:sec-independent protein translocase protein TatC|nr:twin-arginine translocase subunit TatC [Alphaproteobacteria bacterium]
MKSVSKKFSRKTFQAHLNDLRRFIIISIVFYLVLFGVCFYFSQEIYHFFANSLQQVLLKYTLKDEFITTSITEVFSTYMVLAFYISLILFFPFFLLFVFIYLLPVFSKKERKISVLLLILIPTLFFLGASFTYFVAFNVVWDFFIRFSMSSNTILLPKVSEYISLVLNMMFAFGLAFQLPVFLIILALFNIIDEKMILSFSKYAIVLAFVIGAVLTPPDILSQIVVASILLILYFLSYFIVKWIVKME